LYHLYSERLEKHMTLDITVTDMFCGAGGSTTGAVQAGADVRLAINHWQRAIETHNTNYPSVTHALTDLHKANPRRFPSTTILVASPECTSHSLAKGRTRKGQGQLRLDGFSDGKSDLQAEAEERSRCTMWTPLDWAECHDYQAVILENVVDAHLWRPFQSWLHAWRSLDYEFEIVYLNSMHVHPTPQSRDRMYFVAWKRGNHKPNLKITPLAYCHKCEENIESVQSWKNPTRRYGKYRQQYIYCCPRCAKEVTPYYYAAANAIDWSLPAPRIGERKKPLREKTLQRIAYGLQKFAISPFSIPMTRVQDRLRNMIREPFPTQTATETQAMVIHPFLLNLNHPNTRAIAVGKQPFSTQAAYDDTSMVVPPALVLQTSHSECGHESYVSSVYDMPLSTQTTRQELALALPFIAELHGFSTTRSISEPLATVCAGGLHHGLVVPPFLLDHLGEYRPRPITGPCSTICAAGNHHSLVVPPAWLMTYYQHGQMVPIEDAVPTVTTLERCALVMNEKKMNEAATIAVEDCGFRMLVPKEIVRKTINSPLLTHKFANALSLIRTHILSFSDAYFCPNSQLTRKSA
jgi:DNA (cytosine-5)-methyltransferase 1